jgi:hypothetical protein
MYTNFWCGNWEHGKLEVGMMDLRYVECEDERWMELVQDRVQCRTLVLAVLNLRILFPEGRLNSYFR